MIKTGGTWWWLADVIIDNIHYGGNLQPNNATTNFSFTKENITINRSDKNSLFIKATKNPSTVERKTTIVLEAGDYFDYIAITQQAP